MSEDIDKGRRRFLTVATSVVGGIGAAAAAAPFLMSWKPSAKAQALGAPVEVDVSRLDMGAQITVAWRGQPIWIVRRSQEMLNMLPSLNNQLRDPDSAETEQQPAYAQNATRSIKPEFLVLIGLCTHLGCVPTYRPDIGGVGADWPGGFYCPCHGSKYDLAGRVYKGVPAPTNLMVPPHTYVSDSIILVGEHHQGSMA
ncbi:MAG: ubiquinol-cytochrome c reductase iron-sulfur subunit [Legionellales bacterium]|nr:ubiquinol-cytochrome c reductase iron-sulfur subunit [Legionellales bacterium]